jgi:hypothetical protein
MLRARVTIDRRWRWCGVGVFTDRARIGPVDQLPVCLNAADVAAAIERAGPFSRVVHHLEDESEFAPSRWRGRFRIVIDARGRTTVVEAHAYDFGFPELDRFAKILKKLRFEPARRAGAPLRYDCAANVALVLLPNVV